MAKQTHSIELSLEQLLRDREALAVRNRTLAETLHRPSFSQQIRHQWLRLLANSYVPPSRKARNARRILVIRPDHIGDALLATPAIRLLKHYRPQDEVHVLAGPWSASVFENVSEVDVVLTVPFPGFDRRNSSTNLRSPYEFALRTASKIRKIGYQYALILRHDHWWGAWLAQLSGIRYRLGFDSADTALFLTHHAPFKHAHAIEQNLRLVEKFLEKDLSDQIDYRYETHLNDRAFIRGYLAEWGVEPQDETLCLHTGAGTSAKQWEPSKWAIVADILSEQLGATAVFTGSDSELAMIRHIADQMKKPPILVAGDTSLGQLAALYERSRVVLGCDSGPMHIAAAVGTPTVTLFGPADPLEFRPWGNPNSHMILQSSLGCLPCRILDWVDDSLEFHPCVREIEVNDVLSAARHVVNYAERHPLSR
jgi:heptosyltransferase-2/heptosyltransferase-3